VSDVDERKALARPTFLDHATSLHAAHPDGPLPNSGQPYPDADDVAVLPPTSATYSERKRRLVELVTAGEAEEVRLKTTDIAAKASVLFPTPSPLWSAARIHSPDLMLCSGASGPLWVLGELHVALNTLESRVFHTQSDDPTALAAGVAADMAGGRIVVLHPNDSPEVSPRTYPPLSVHVPGRYAYWSYGRDAGPPAGAESLAATSLYVRRSGDALVVEPRDASWRWPLLETFGEILTALVVNRFKLRKPAPYLPRVLLDDLMICRRSWRLRAADLSEWARHSGKLAGHLRSLGLPRYVFAKTALEAKPFFVDLSAPLLLRNLTCAVRLANHASDPTAYVDLVEMQPGPDDLWLTDSTGDRYTAEFRFVAVDNRHPMTELTMLTRTS
jgi:hypothetical protein